MRQSGLRHCATAFLTLATMLCAASPGARADITLEPLIAGLSGPVRLVAPSEDDRLFVVERIGRIRVFDPDGSERSTFLDITGLTSTESERGLLGLAFPPDYSSSGRFYVYYTDNNGPGVTTAFVASYKVSGDPDVADPTSAEIFLSIPQPYSNHNGGHLEFGPDGMLYLGLGDGGSGGDPGDRAQNDQELLGKMLRLDVSGTTGYSIPADNPFVGKAPLDEIWAKGLRNPWCFSFDSATGDLYIADVGQLLLEEIDVAPSTSSGGENYGWRLMEGSNCYNPPTHCNHESLTLPVYEYDHQDSKCSISGGYVYRGSAIPELSGLYFFADYCSGQVWTLRWTPGGGVSELTERTAALTEDGLLYNVAAFGQDGHGELYILELVVGAVHRIVSKTTPNSGGSIGGLKGHWRQH